jgi:hypothetical protein
MNEDFEQRLQCQPLRKVPTEWRAEILAAARPAACSTPRISFLSRLLSTINYQPSTALRWSSLAAAWVVILVLNHAARDTSLAASANSAPPSPQMILALRQQQKLLAELVDSPAQNVADKPKPFSPRPRSECVVEIMTV